MSDVKTIMKLYKKACISILFHIIILPHLTSKIKFQSML